MKYLPAIAGGLLGLLFFAFSLMYFLKVFPVPTLPPGPMASYMAAMMPTGYMNFVKALEMTGGILVAIPRTRNFGLLVLGPIIINILAFHIFIAKGEGLVDPVLIVICLLAAYLLWVGRKAFGGLLRQS